MTDTLNKTFGERRRLSSFIGCSSGGVFESSNFAAPILLLVCTLAFLGTGCSVTRGFRSPDGTVNVSNYRLLWKSEAVIFTASVAAPDLQPATFNVQLQIGQSASDSRSVAAITEGAVKGLTRP